MKPKRLILFFVLVSILLPAVSAARPWVYIYNPDGTKKLVPLGHIHVTNTDSTYYGVWLHGEIYARRMNWSMVYQVDSRVLESLPVGTREYSLSDLEPLRNQQYLEPYKGFFLRTGTVPADSYRYSITLMPIGGGDTVIFTVAPSSPPRLLRPLPHDSLTDPRPLFSWTPPTPPERGIRYEFRLVELLPGQSAEEGIAANPPLHLNRNLVTNSLKYPPSAPALPRQSRFAWQVTALTQNGDSLPSEVGSFQFPTTTRRKWWQCDRTSSHFWQGDEEQRHCPVTGCGGMGGEFQPPELCQLYWQGDSLVARIHVKQEIVVNSIRIIVSWVSKNGRQAADAELTRTFEPPEEHRLCDTLTVRAAWPTDFTATHIVKPVTKDKLNLDRTRVTVKVNGQKIAEGRKPGANPP